MDINHKELEKQMRNSILKTGKYLKLEILIGTENIDVNGHEGNMPCVSMDMKHIGPKEIGCLYLCLQEMIKHLEKAYPMACLTAKLTSKCTNLGDVEYKPDEEEN